MIQRQVHYLHKLSYIFYDFHSLHGQKIRKLRLLISRHTHIIVEICMSNHTCPAIGPEMGKVNKGDNNEIAINK